MSEPETIQESGNNGKPKIPEAHAVIEMKIIFEQGKLMVVHFPFLNDKIASYGFLKMAEKTLDAHYKDQETKVVQSNGGIMNFIRGKR